MNKLLTYCMQIFLFVMRMVITQVLYVGASLPNMGAARERSEFDVKPPLAAPLLNSRL